MSSRHPVLVVALLVAAAVCAAAQREGGKPEAGQQFLGVWSGSWSSPDGASGGIELTLEREKDKPLAGRLSVTGEPEYKATFVSVEFDGAKMTARYDFPPDPAAGVVLAATFDGDAATGTWSLYEKASGNEVISGTWKVKRDKR